jgi:aspartyl protease family protein
MMKIANSRLKRIPAWLVLLAGFSCAIVWGSGQAANISVKGLFRDKALLVIDGKRRLVSAGETTPEGIKLISANSKEAVIEIDGQEETYTLGAHIGGNSKSSSKKPEARVWANERGMFATIGTINGFPVSFLVDTGATSVAISSNEARRLGINYKSSGQKVGVQTASGYGVAYQIKLTSVSLGRITLYNVDAVVLEGSSPVTPLLGMSFLGNLEIENRGNMMLMRKKY